MSSMFDVLTDVADLRRSLALQRERNDLLNDELERMREKLGEGKGNEKENAVLVTEGRLEPCKSHWNDTDRASLTRLDAT